MWTPTTREQHNRKAQRYQSDLTDEEWRVIEPHLPEPRATARPRSWAMREIVNGIFYVMRAGCAWRLLPTDFPPWGTIYRWFATFRDDGHFEAINHTLVMADRERVGREASMPLFAMYPHLAYFGQDLRDFADTAALIEEMDLVISTDTATAHLAGALGKPVWLMLTYAADFRWLLYREDSPWYPTMRLFRQARPGDWHTVVERLRDGLTAFCSDPVLIR